MSKAPGPMQVVTVVLVSNRAAEGVRSLSAQTAVCGTSLDPHRAVQRSAPNSHFINQDGPSPGEFMSLLWIDHSGAIVPAQT